MKITKRNVLTGEFRTAELEVTPAQIAAWQSGTLIQHAMPHLPESHREFLVTGTTPDDWIEHLGSDPDQMDLTPVPLVQG